MSSEVSTIKVDQKRKFFLRKIQTAYSQLDSKISEWLSDSLAVMSLGKSTTLQQAVAQTFNQHFDQPIQLQIELDLGMYLLVSFVRQADAKGQDFLLSKYVEDKSLNIPDYVHLDFDLYQQSINIRLEMYQSSWDLVTIEQYIQKYLYQQPITVAPTPENMNTMREMLTISSELYKALMCMLKLEVKPTKVGRPSLPDQLKTFIEQFNKVSIKEHNKLRYKHGSMYQKIHSQLFTTEEADTVKECVNESLTDEEIKLNLTRKIDALTLKAEEQGWRIKPKSRRIVEMKFTGM